jgi:hypothetical protein
LADFALAAHPVLRGGGFGDGLRADKQLDFREDWRGASSPPRQLLDWSTVREAARRGRRDSASAWRRTRRPDACRLRVRHTRSTLRATSSSSSDGPFVHSPRRTDM